MPNRLGYLLILDESPFLTHTSLSSTKYSNETVPYLEPLRQKTLHCLLLLNSFQVGDSFITIPI